MIGVGGYVLAGKVDVAFLGLKHVLAAFRLDAALELLLALFWFLVVGVLISLAGHGAIVCPRLLARITRLTRLTRPAGLPHAW